MTLHRLLYQCWRVLHWVLLALALLAAGLAAALWWANRDDEPLRPEVARLLRFDLPAPEAMRSNGYFVLLGLGADDPLAAGQRLLQAQKQDYEEFHRTGQWYADRSSRTDAVGIPKYFLIAPLSCDSQKDDCYAHYLKHADAIRAKLSEYAPLIDRYLSVLDMPVYEEVAIPDIIAIRWPRYESLSELVDMRAALLLAEGRIDAALALLERNARLHQRILEGSRTAVGALIELMADMRQQRLVSSAARHLPVLTAAYADRLAGLLKSTPTPMAAPLEGETRQALSVIKWMIFNPAISAGNQVPWLDKKVAQIQFRLVFLPHATLNLSYALRQENIRLARLPADQLAAQAAIARQAFADATPKVWPLRNIGGRYLLAMEATPSLMMYYIERAHDIEGHRRLVRLQITALHERVPLEDMADWLAKQPPELRNPYTLQPMGWDASTQSLVFEGRQRQIQNPDDSPTYRVRLAPAPCPSC